MLRTRLHHVMSRFACPGAARLGAANGSPPIGPPVVSKRGAVGFTLIELLVVIAIIALLVSLLMPSLKQAKDLARQSACLSNMRMVAMAIPQYADENDGYMPRYGEKVETHEFARRGIDVSWYEVDQGKWDGGVGGVIRYALIRVIQTNWADPLYDGDGFLAPYISGGEGRRDHIIGCPSLSKEPVPAVAYSIARAFSTRIERAKGYGLNWNEGVCKLNEENNPAIRMRLGEVHRPSELVFMCDGLGALQEIRNHYTYPDGEGQWGQNTAFIPADRHFGAFNMAFVGGHADSGALYDRFTDHYFKNTMPR